MSPCSKFIDSSTIELMNPKFCIQIVSTLYPWDKIGTKLGQCFFGPNRAWLSVLSIVLDSYYLELINKVFRNVLLCSWFMEWTKMNEHFKLSKTSRNDLESICIVIRSVLAKFGLPRMFRRGTRGWIQLSQISTQSIRDFVSTLGTVN